MLLLWLLFVVVVFVVVVVDVFFYNFNTFFVARIPCEVMNN